MPSGPRLYALWAGNSLAVLLKTYAKCLDRQDEAAKRHIEDALGDPGEPDGHDPGKDG